eukprot:g21994.t1
MQPCLLAALFALLTPTRGFAQPKPGYAPSATHVYPAGAQRGTAIDINVGGECLPPGAWFTMFGRGLHVGARSMKGDAKLKKPAKQSVQLSQRINDSGEPSPRRKPTETPITYPKEWAARVAVDKAAPPGIARWRVSCAQGGTATRPFVVGDLPEFLERESNSTFDTANPVVLPVTVNGRIHGERDLDHFRFAVQPGDVVVCEVLAARLESKLDPIVTILNADGRPIATESIFVENDPVVAFRATSADEYVLRIANVSHHGDPALIYRVNITTQPFVRSVFPTSGTAGTRQPISFRLMTGTAQTRVVKKTVSFPKARPATRHFVYRLQHQGTQTANAIPLSVISPDTQQVGGSGILPVPAHTERRLATPNDQHPYRFAARKGIRYSITCDTGYGSKAFPTMLVTNAAGKRIAFIRSIADDNRRCEIEWKAPADQTISVRIRDQRFGAVGGDEFTYRLSIREAVPDFRLNLLSDSANVLPEGELRLPVTVSRTGGFAEPITLSVEGLPADVTAEPVTITGSKTRANIVIKASKQARCQSVRLKIVGQAKQGGQRVATLKAAAASATDRSDLFLTVRHKPVFRLYCSEAYLYAHRGSVFMYPMEIERLDGFDGKITLQIGDRQNRDLDGIQMFEVATPPGKSDVELPIYLPETMHINIQSQSQLYSQAYAIFTDKHGQQQSVLVVSEKRNMLRTLPPVVKLKSVDTSVSASPGGIAECRLKLERTSNFPGAMNVELLPTQRSRGFTAKRVRIDAQKHEAMPRSIYLHVPFCRHRCGYCDFTLVAGRDELADSYLDALRIELDGMTDQPEIETLFVGGGTPTHLSADRLAKLFQLIGDRVRFASDAEVSVEANPADFAEHDSGPEKLAVLADAGVNRISLGVQSFDDRILQTLERDHRRRDIERAIDVVTSRVANVSIDLIFGVPGQTPRLWQETLNEAISLSPMHISTYGLTFEKGTAFWTRRNKGELVDVAEEAERHMYADAMDLLAAAGFKQYELSNFARPGHRCRHNEVYWSGKPFYGFGPGAARYIDGRRVSNHRSVTTWIKRTLSGDSAEGSAEELSPAERARELLVVGLRKTDGVDKQEFFARTGYTIDQLAGPDLEIHFSNGLLEQTPTHLRLTRAGRFLADTVIVDCL